METYNGQEKICAQCKYMKKILLLLLTPLVNSVFATNIIGQESGFWESSEIVTGQVVGYAKLNPKPYLTKPINPNSKFDPGETSITNSDFQRIDKVAIIDVNSIKVPKEYQNKVGTCKAYAVLYLSEWNLYQIVCDYKKDAEVRIIYNGDIEPDPRNIGDTVSITTDVAVPIKGYFKGWVYPRGSFESNNLIDKTK